MKKFLIQVLTDDESATLEYLRRFQAEDIANAVRIIDAAMNARPRKKRADAGTSRKEGAPA